MALPSMLSVKMNNMFGRLDGITSLSLFVVERRPLSLDGSQDRLYHAARGLSMTAQYPGRTDLNSRRV